MVSVVACLVLGLVLLASATAKLVDRHGTQAALATYGIRGAARAVWVALVVVEAALGAAVAAGSDAAAYAAAGLMGVFAVAQGAALAALPQLPRSEPTTEQWLGIGLAAALIGLVALGVVVLALAREVGVLRLAVDPRGALEVAHEGPEVGARTALAERFELAGGRIGLAVF